MLSSFEFGDRCTEKRIAPYIPPPPNPTASPLFPTYAHPSHPPPAHPGSYPVSHHSSPPQTPLNPSFTLPAPAPVPPTTTMAQATIAPLSTHPPTLTHPPCHRALVHTRIASPLTAPATPCQRVDDYQSESFARQPRHHVSYDDNSRSTASREVAVTRNIRKVADIGGVCHARLLKIAYPQHRRI